MIDHDKPTTKIETWLLTIPHLRVNGIFPPCLRKERILARGTARLLFPWDALDQTIGWGVFPPEQLRSSCVSRSDSHVLLLQVRALSLFFFHIFSFPFFYALIRYQRHRTVCQWRILYGWYICLVIYACHSIYARVHPCPWIHEHLLFLTSSLINVTSTSCPILTNTHGYLKLWLMLFNFSPSCQPRWPLFDELAGSTISWIVPYKIVSCYFCLHAHRGTCECVGICYWFNIDGWRWLNRGCWKFVQAIWVKWRMQDYQ